MSGQEKYRTEVWESTGIGRINSTHCHATDRHRKTQLRITRSVVREPIRKDHPVSGILSFFGNQFREFWHFREFWVFRDFLVIRIIGNGNFGNRSVSPPKFRQSISFTAENQFRRELLEFDHFCHRTFGNRSVLHRATVGTSSEESALSATSSNLRPTLVLSTSRSQKWQHHLQLM